MDKVPVFGTGDVGSIPTKGTRKKTTLLPCSVLRGRNQGWGFDSLSGHQ